MSFNCPCSVAPFYHAVGLSVAYDVSMLLSYSPDSWTLIHSDTFPW